MAVQTQIQTRRGTAASWTSTNPTLAAGEIGFESDTGKFKIGNGSTAWASLAYSAGATAVTYLFNATAAQTTFSGADANGLTLAYTVGAEQVYLNGALQVRGSDYTATNGTSIVLTSGALVNDVLNVIAYSAMTITDTYTQAQADAKFFQTANEFSAGKNKIINGDFGVWQRGTSITATSGAYTYGPDRFSVYGYGVGTGTVTQQTFTPGTAPVAGYEGQFFARFKSTNTNLRVQQPIEDVRTFAGQTVAVSFWMKSPTGTTADVFYGQNFGSGGSAGVDIAGSTITISSSWARYTATVAIPSVAGKTIGTGSYLAIRFGAAINLDIDIWGVQMEVGSIATPFQTATGTKQGELAACQRYYYRRGGTSVNGPYTPMAQGIASSSTAAEVSLFFPVSMRIAPTAVESSATVSWLALWDGSALIALNAAPTIPGGGNGPDGVRLTVATAATLTSFRFYSLVTNNAATGFLAFSAEL